MNHHQDMPQTKGDALDTTSGLPAGMELPAWRFVPSQGGYFEFLPQSEEPFLVFVDHFTRRVLENGGTPDFLRNAAQEAFRRHLTEGRA